MHPEEWNRKFQSCSPDVRSGLLTSLITQGRLTRHEVQLMRHLLKQWRDALSSCSTELACEILSYLAYPDLLVCRQVCKQWKQLTHTNMLWRRYCVQNSVGATRDYEAAFRAYMRRERAWQRATPTSKGTLAHGHEERVNCIRLVGGTPWMVSGSMDRSIIVWNMETYSMERRWTCDAVFVLDANAHHVVVSHFQGHRCSVWTLQGVHVGDLRGHTAIVKRISMTDEHTLTVGDDGMLIVWHTSTATMVTQWNDDGLRVLDACWLDDRIALMNLCGHASVLQFAQGALYRQHSLPLSADVLLVHPIAADQFVMVYDCKSVFVRITSEGMQMQVKQSPSSRNGMYCFCVSKRRLVYHSAHDASLCIHDYGTDKQARYTMWKTRMTFPSWMEMDDDRVLIGCMDGSISVVSFSTRHHLLY